MRGVEEEFEDVDQMMEKLKPKGTAEAFLKAHEYFQQNKDKEPDDERPAPMTAAEWRKILDEQDDEAGEFGLMEAGEEEEGCADDCEDDEEGGEPP